MNRIHLAIGIVLYKNNLDILFKSLLSFKKQNISGIEIDIELGLLDNSGGQQIERVLEFAKENYLSVLVHDQGGNIGFGSGHNYLFQQFVKANKNFDYYLCINPDGIPHYKMIESLVFFAKSKNNKGLFEAKQFPIEHPKFYDPKSFLTSWCSGCCVLFPCELYEKLNGFDEAFFLYCEDVDISWRAQFLGYPCYTVPNAFFYHYVFGEDRDLDRQELEMTISTYKLAIKYGNTETASKELSKLSELLSKGELERINSQMPSQFFSNHEPIYVDFNHGRHFSKARW